MNSRYRARPFLTKERLRNFVALDNLTPQVPLIELVKQGRSRFVRIWTAYDYERMHGTYTAIYNDGSVCTITVYPNGQVKAKTNKEKDK